MSEHKADNSTGDVVTAIHQNRLPEQFWSLESFKDKPHLVEIHQMLVQRLQDEAPDADTLELMAMERVAFLYIFMRAREADSEKLAFDRSYKDMMTTWTAMAADLRKQRMRAEETSSIRMSIVSDVVKAVKEALKDEDPALANKIQTRLVTLAAV